MPGDLLDEEETETIPDDEGAEDSGSTETDAAPPQASAPTVVSADTSTAADAPLLPPYVPPKPTHYANSFALDWQGTYDNLTPAQKQAVDASTNNPKDPDGAKKRYVNKWAIYEQTGQFPDSPESYVAARKGVAVLNGWDIDGKTDKEIDSKFHAAFKQKATAEKAENEAVNGMASAPIVQMPERPAAPILPFGITPTFMQTLPAGPAPDTAALMKSRQDSLTHQAYFGGSEADHTAGPVGEVSQGAFDKVDSFFKWEEANKTKTMPENLPQRWALWSRLFDQGQEDRSVAAEAAKQSFTALARSGDVGGVDIGKAIAPLRNLTDEQQRLAVQMLGEMKGGQEGVEGVHLKKGEKDSLGFGEDADKAVAQGMVAAGRMQENFWNDEDIQNKQDALRGMKFAEGDKVPVAGEGKEGANFVDGRLTEHFQHLGDTEGFMADSLPTATLTKEQADAANKEVASRLKDFEFAYKLRGMAQGGLNSLRRDTLPQKAVQTIAEMGTLIAYTATPLGLPIRVQAYRQNTYQDLVAQGVDPDSATKMAWVIAPVQAGFDQATMGLLSKNPVIDGFFKKWGTNAMARFALRTAGHTAGMTAIQEAREATAPFVQDWSHAMDSNIPGPDWIAVGKQMGDSLPETAATMLLLSAFGAGHAHAQDFKGPGIDVLARDPKALAFLGFRDSQIENVVAASKDGAGEAFLEEFRRRSPQANGDSKYLTPAGAAELAKKAQDKVAGGEKAPVTTQPVEGQEPTSGGEQASEPMLRTALREHFPDATDEELAGLESQVSPDFAAHEAEANKLAGVRDIFRNPETGQWALHMEDDSVRDSGDIDSTLQMRDELAAKWHQEAEKEAQKQEEKPKEENGHQKRAVAAVHALTSDETGGAVDLDTIELAAENARRGLEKGRPVDWAKETVLSPHIGTGDLAGLKEAFSTPEGIEAVLDEVKRRQGGEPHEEKETAAGQAQGSEVLTEPDEAGKAEGAARTPEKSGTGSAGPSEPAASESAPSKTASAPETEARISRDEGAPAQPEKPTNISNAEMDEQAKAAGVEPSPGMPKWQAEEMRKKAAETARENPSAAQDLVESLKKENRTLSPEETFLLGHEKIRLAKEAADLLARRDDKKASQADRDEAAVRLRLVDEKQQELRDVSKLTGSASGSSLGARSFLFNNDLSLSDLRSNFRDEANRGEPLNEKQEKLIKDLHAKLAEHEATIAKLGKSEENAAAFRSEMARVFREFVEAEKAKTAPALKGKARWRALRQEGLEQFRKGVAGKSGAGSIFADPDALAGAVKWAVGMLGEGYEKAADFVVAAWDDLKRRITEADAEKLIKMARKELPAHQEAEAKEAESGEQIPLRDDGVKDYGEYGKVHNYTIDQAGEQTTLTVPEGTPAAELQRMAREKVSQFRQHAETSGNYTTGQLAGLKEKFQGIKDKGLANMAEVGKPDPSGRLFSGPEKLAQFVYGAAQYGVGLIGEFGIKGAELGARLVKELKEHWPEIGDHLDKVIPMAEEMHGIFAEELAKSAKRGAKPSAQKKDSADIALEAAQRLADKWEKRATGEEGPQRRFAKEPKSTEEADLRGYVEALKAHVKEVGDRNKKALKEAGERAAMEEDFARRIQDEGTRAEQKAQDDFIQEHGEKAAQEEDFQKRVEAAGDKARKEASDELMKEVGRQTAFNEDQKARFERRIQAEAEAGQRAESRRLVKKVGDAQAKAEDFQRNLQKQADKAQRDTEMAGLNAERRRIAALEKSVAEYERKAAEGDVIPKGKKQGAPTEDAARLEAMRDAARDVFKKARESSEDYQKYREARQLEAQKASVARQIEAVRQRIENKDFGPRPKKVRGTDPELEKAQVEKKKVLLEFERAKEAERLKNRTNTEKVLDALAAWKRTAVLLSGTVYGKLGTAAGEGIAMTSIEDAVGGILGHLPGLSKIAAEAPRHGSFVPSAQAGAITALWSHMFSDAKSIWQTGKMDIDLLHGKEKIYVDKGLAAFVGRTHYILKSPAKRAEFLRSLETREAFYRDKKGMTEEHMAQPKFQAQLATEAFADANRSIFTEDNWMTSAWKRGMGYFEQKVATNKAAGHMVPALGFKLLTTLAKWHLPVVRIPTNVVFRTFEYGLGLPLGIARLGAHIYQAAYKDGKLMPEHADLIMRNLKRGTVGAALMTIGALNPGAIGGYWLPGRQPGDEYPDFGEVRINGWNVPKWAVHNPALECLQFGATIRHMMDSRVNRHSSETHTLGEGVQKAAGELLEEIPFINEAKHLEEAAFEDKKKSFLGEEVKGAIPGVVQQVGHKMDPRKDKKGKNLPLDPKGFNQTVEEGVPKLRENVPLKKGRR